MSELMYVDMIHPHFNKVEASFVGQREYYKRTNAGYCKFEPRSQIMGCLVIGSSALAVTVVLSNVWKEP
jgi:hypothetical protein